MANYQLRLEARELRSQGVSVKTIAKTLGISKSTSSIWVRDIILSVEQLEALRQSSIKGSERGRLKGALAQKEKKRKLLEEAKIEGIKQLSQIQDKELFVMGLALYWGEGGKRSRRIEFCNSDPKMIQFLLYWFKKYFSVQNEAFVCTVGINEIHKEREQMVREYWSNVSGVPLTQFYKTSFKHSVSKKVFANFEEHYGTLSIVVRKSALMHCRLMGLIEGLIVNSLRLGSSMAEQSFHKRSVCEFESHPSHSGTLNIIR